MMLLVLASAASAAACSAQPPLAALAPQAGAGPVTDVAVPGIADTDQEPDAASAAVPGAEPEAGVSPRAEPDATHEVDSDQVCGTDDDCVFSSVWHAIESAEDCHWSCCSGAVMNRTAAERFQAGFHRWCASRSDELQSSCVSATCEMRGRPRCLAGRCSEMQPEELSEVALPLLSPDTP
jgi:hypothetical protein